MSGIHAIPTFYAGTLFRSRTEARWAVLFDELCIAWEYEPEGWQLPNGLKYIPDFRLPGCDVWIEVKRPLNTLSEREIYEMFMKADGLSRSTGEVLVFAADRPDFSWYECIKACPYGIHCSLCDASWEACDALGPLPRQAIFAPGRVVFDEDDLEEGDFDALRDAIDVVDRKRFDRLPFKSDLQWKKVSA